MVITCIPKVRYGLTRSSQSHLPSNISLCVNGWPGLRKWKTSAEGGTRWHHVFQKDLKGTTSRSQRFFRWFWSKYLQLLPKAVGPEILAAECQWAFPLDKFCLSVVKLLSNIILICLDLGMELLQSFLMCFCQLYPTDPMKSNCHQNTSLRMQPLVTGISKVDRSLRIK